MTSLSAAPAPPVATDWRRRLALCVTVALGLLFAELSSSNGVLRPALRFVSRVRGGPNSKCLPSAAVTTALRLVTASAAGAHGGVRGECCVGAAAQQVCWPRPSSPFRVLFLTANLDARGTNVAVFDYMKAMEELACGQSYVATFEDAAQMDARPKFEARFPGRVLLTRSSPAGRGEDVARLVSAHGLDAVYNLQWGAGLPMQLTGGVKLLLHAVFNAAGGEEEGSSLAVISESVPRPTSVPVVPHIVAHNASLDDAPSLRIELGIPATAVVFCRHGGLGSFSVRAARAAVCAHARAHAQANDTFFLLLGTAPEPCEAGLANVVHLPTSTDLVLKQRFLNTCNACLHGRMDGETFGLAVGECSSAGLPVITYAHAPADADFHLRVLGEHALRYSDEAGLMTLLAGFDVGWHLERRGLYAHIYDRFLPGPVMLNFLEHFGILVDVIAGGSAGNGDTAA